MTDASFGYSGTLYILVDSKQRSLLVKHDWKWVAHVWPAILRAPPSEKPSIIQLLDVLSNLLHRYMETTALRMPFTDASIEAARTLTHVQLTKEEMEAAVQRELKEGRDSENTYYELVSSLTNLLTSGTLHWRLYNLAFNMLCLQLRADVPLPAESVRIFVQNLVHDAIAVRKIAIKGVAAIMKQQKRKHPQIVIDPAESARQFGFLAAGATPQPDQKFPGDRWETSWMQYQAERQPLTAETWDEPRCV